MPSESRWPPVYDFEELAASIKGILGSGTLEKMLYDPSDVRPSFFQGDVIRLQAEIPFIGHEGEVRVEEAPPFWAIIGNTCDFDKSVEDAAFTQLTPVWDVASNDEVRDAVSLSSYRYYTQFYLPPWDSTVEGRVYVADFLRPVTVHKNAFRKANVAARLSRKGWFLFHACVVRFLARDDGRND